MFALLIIGFLVIVSWTFINQHARCGYCGGIVEHDSHCPYKGRDARGW